MTTPKPYEYTDKIIRYLTKRFVALFGNAKSRLLPMDEINVLRYTDDLYAELEAITVAYFAKMASKVYRDTVKEGKRKINEKWVRDKLSDFDPVTLYVFLQEVKRKRSRFAEAYIASGHLASEVDKALRYWSRMVNQYAVELTDSATLEAYRDDGVKKVKWLTFDDEKRCRECAKLDGKVFDIGSVPPKPHINCRCFLLPYYGEV